MTAYAFGSGRLQPGRRRGARLAARGLGAAVLAPSADVFAYACRALRFELPTAASDPTSEAHAWLAPTWLAAVLALFVVVHAGAEFAALPFRLPVPIGGTARAFAFYTLVGIVAFPFLRGLASALRNSAVRALLARSLVLALSTFLATSALVFPYREKNGFVSLAILYFRMARAPFVQGTGWLHKRLLLPAIAWPLPSDPRAFCALSLFITFFGVFALVLLTESWLERAGVDTNAPLVRLPLHIALATTNPVIFSFQSPGFPDLLGLGILWVAAALPLASRARASAIALGVVAHEGVFFAALPLVAVASPREERRLVGLVAGAYALAWLSTISVATRSIALQLRPDHTAAWVWLAAYPGRAALGVLSAFKAMWALVVASVAAAFCDGQRRFAISVLAVVASPLLLLPVTVDTSRLAGFGVAGLVACVAFTLERAHSDRRWKIFAWLIVVATALWPSTYVGLNCDETVFNGVHAVLRRGALFVE